MGMPPDELVANALEDLVDIKGAVFLPYLRLENDVKQQVAEFFSKTVGIVVVDGFKDFVCLFDEHGFEGVPILFPIPWATVWAPQPGHDLNEVFELCSSHSV